MSAALGLSSVACAMDAAAGYRPDAPGVARRELFVHVPAPPQSGALAPTHPGADAAPPVAPAAPAAARPDPSDPPVAPPPAPAAQTVSTPVIPAEVDVHEASKGRGNVEVKVDRGRAGEQEEVELDLPSLEKESEAIREALPADGAPSDEAEAEPEFDIPIVVNRQVERWMDYFQTIGRKHMARWLARSERYIPMMQSILREHGLPADLVYLALIESGFSTSAQSAARAVGPWQFIQGTAQRYGLRIDWWIDERRNPEKSTIAAASYLKDLHEMFGSWYLAAAGYNAGEGKIVRAIARYDTDDFWEIAERRYLAAETRQYVPKLIAAALIAKNPEKYGFTDIEYEEPLVYDKVTVEDATDLRLVAWAAETSYEEIKKLNPELRRWATPPGYPGYQANVPFGKKEVFERNFGKITPSQRITYRRHVVRRGDTISGIARRYGVEQGQVRRMNGLRGNLLRAGQSLIVPLPAGRVAVAAASEDGRVEPGSRTVATAKRAPSKIGAGKAMRLAKTDGRRVIRYVVRRGDTLWEIAQRHDVTVSDLRRWNRMSRRHVLKAGERVIIRLQADQREKDARLPAVGSGEPGTVSLLS